MPPIGQEMTSWMSYESDSFTIIKPATFETWQLGKWLQTNQHHDPVTRTRHFCVWWSRKYTITCMSSIIVLYLFHIQMMSQDFWPPCYIQVVLKCNEESPKPSKVELSQVVASGKEALDLDFLSGCSVMT